MRVTEKQIFQAATADSQRARQRLEGAVGELTSGRRFEHPGDDPAAAGLVSTARFNADRFDAIRQTIGRALDELSTAEGAVSQTMNLVTRAKEIATQLGSDSYGPNSRANGAAEVDGLFQSLVGLLNTRVGNRYVFGGNLDGAPPFDASGNYLGDDAYRQVEIAPGVLENVSMRADVAFKGAAGGEDVFRLLSDLASALRSNDGPGIRATLDRVDGAIQQISQALSDAGASTNVLETAQNANLELRDRETKTVARLADTDVIEAASRLTLANQALEASISATAKSFQLTLLDKL